MAGCNELELGVKTKQKASPLDEFFIPAIQFSTKLFLGYGAKSTFSYLNGQVQGKLLREGGGRRGKERESKREQEKAKKPLLGKACHQGAKTTWNSCPQTPGSLQTNIPTQNEKIRKRGRGKHTRKKKKRIKRGGERRGRETYLRSLVCSFGQKWWEEKAWRSREVWGRKRWRRRNSSRSKLYKTSPRVSGGRTVIPAEQVRTDLFSATPGNTNLGTDWRVTPLLMTFFSFSFL